MRTGRMAVLVALALAACERNTEVTGAVAGTSFETSQSWGYFENFATGMQVANVLISDGYAQCSELEHAKPNSQGLLFRFFRANNQEILPARYTAVQPQIDLTSATGFRDLPKAGVLVIAFSLDNECQNRLFSQAGGGALQQLEAERVQFAQGGTATLESVAGNVFSGTFDVFWAGDHVVGEFNSEGCGMVENALDTASCGGGPSGPKCYDEVNHPGCQSGVICNMSGGVGDGACQPPERCDTNPNGCVIGQGGACGVPSSPNVCVQLCGVDSPHPAAKCPSLTGCKYDLTMSCDGSRSDPCFCL